MPPRSSKSSSLHARSSRDSFDSLERRRVQDACRLVTEGGAGDESRLAKYPLLMTVGELDISAPLFSLAAVAAAARSRRRGRAATWRC